MKRRLATRAHRFDQQFPNHPGFVAENLRRIAFRHARDRGTILQYLTGSNSKVRKADIYHSPLSLDLQAVMNFTSSPFLPRKGFFRSRKQRSPTFRQRGSAYG